MPNSSRHVPGRAALSYSCLLAGLAMSVVLLSSMTSRALETPTLAGTPAEQFVEYDSILPPTDEGRAQFGNIFVGHVVAVSGEDKIPTSDPEDDLRAILYEIEVEQTLQGNAKGRVTIWYEGADYRGPDATGPGYQHSGELNVGERYLFFAGFDADHTWYPVNATIGVIPITSNREAAELVAKFEPLIQDAERLAEQQARQPVEVDPCEQPKSAPTIIIEPAQGAAGDKVRVTGMGFIRPQVSIWWDEMNDKLASTSVEQSCEITKGVTIPKAAPGRHRILVEDAGGNVAEATFEVVKE